MQAKGSGLLDLNELEKEVDLIMNTMPPTVALDVNVEKLPFC